MEVPPSLVQDLHHTQMKAGIWNRGILDAYSPDVRDLHRAQDL